MGKGSDSGWDTKPKLDEARALAPETPQHRSRKNTRRWCRGKAGVEHQLAVVKHAYIGPPEDRTCLWWPWGKEKYRTWHCCHVERCTECGKNLRHLVGRECPDWKPRDE